MRQIVFHVNRDKPGADAVRQRLAALAASLGLSECGSGEQPEAVVVLGGDGTMLSAVHRFPGVPLLGLNLGSLGYLAGVEAPHFENALLALASGDYEVSRRTTLRVGDAVALNDVVSIRDAERVRTLLEKIGLPRPMLVCNRMREEKIKKGEQPAWTKMAERLDMPLLGVAPEDDAIRQAAQKGVPVVKGNSPSGEAFKRIARRLCGESVEIQKLKKRGIMDRIWELMGIRSRNEVRHAE